MQEEQKYVLFAENVSEEQICLKIINMEEI